MELIVDIQKKLHHFSLQIQFEAGQEIIGLLGASGCGKSMTLKCIAGIEKPDQGRIILNGDTLFDSGKNINLPVQKRGIGYLFQNYALFPHMTVEQNITSGMQGKRHEKKAEAARLMERFYLQGLERQYPTQLSGGQQQRVTSTRSPAPPFWFPITGMKYTGYAAGLVFWQMENCKLSRKNGPCSRNPKHQKLVY